MAEIVAIGELLVDFSPVGTDADGYPTLAANPGGAPANFLAAAAKAGGRTAFLGKVGDDAFGRLLRDTLERAGIDTRGLIVDRETFTTLAFVTLDAQGDREFSFARKPGADTQLRFDELRLDLIDEARVFHFGTLSLTNDPARDATVRAVAYAREHGKLISFDPNLRRPLWKDSTEAKHWMLWGLSQADVVKLSDEEAEFLFALPPEAAAAHVLRQYPVRLVYVTCGARGCCFANAHCAGFVAAPKGLPIIDTTGAGDIFGGTAMQLLLQTGKTPDGLGDAELHALVGTACAAASLSATKHGGLCSVPEPERVRQFCRELR